MPEIADCIRNTPNDVDHIDHVKRRPALSPAWRGDRAPRAEKGLWHRIVGLIHQLGSSGDDGPISRIHY